MTYDAATNSQRCYDLAISLLREQAIRRGEISPRADNPAEIQWASEGENSQGLATRMAWEISGSFDMGEAA